MRRSHQPPRSSESQITAKAPGMVAPFREFRHWLLVFLAMGAVFLVESSIHAGECLCTTASGAGLDGRAGWHAEWTVQLPFDSGRTRLVRVVSSKDVVVGQAADGSVHAIAASGPKKGCCLWSWPRGESSVAIHFSPAGSASVYPPAISSERVVVTLDRTVFGIDIRTGLQVYAYTFGPSLSTTSGESGKWLYSPTLEGSIIRAPADPLLRDPSGDPADADQKRSGATRSDGRSPWEPITLTSGGVVRLQPQPLGEGGIWWINDQGSILSLVSVGGRWSRGTIETGSPVVGEPVVRENDIWIASEDGKLSHFQADPDKSFRIFRRWRVPLPAYAAGEMLLSEDVLVISLGADGLVAYDAYEGDDLWRIPSHCRLLAAGDGQAWVIDPAGFLSCLSLRDGRTIDRGCLAGFSLPIHSMQVGRLLLASPEGLVRSLVPNRSLQPRDSDDAAPDEPDRDDASEDATDREADSSDAEAAEDRNT